MKNKILKTLVPLVLLAGTSGFFVPAALAQAAGGCLPPRAVQEAAASGQILQLPQILAMNGLQPSDVVGSAQVCDQNGQLFYVLPVLKDSNAATIRINAHTGMQ